MTYLTSDLIPKLRNGLIDILFYNQTDKNYGNDIEVINCKKVNDCFVVNKDYKELINKKISLQELNNYPLILQAKESNTREFIDKVASKYNVIFKPNIELASYSLVVEFAKIGLGIGYVTKDYIHDELESKQLYELQLEENSPSRNISMALSKNHLPNFSTKKLIEIIKKEN